MATAPYLISFTLTQATATTPSRLEVIAAPGDSIGPLTIEIPGVTLGIVAMDSSGAGPGLYAYVTTNLPAGSFGGTVYDASPAKLPSFTVPLFTVNAPPVVRGCTDPGADNYDPLATDDNGTCVYSPHLVLADLPELAALGVPLNATLSAAAVPGMVPALATVLFDLSGLGSTAGVKVRVNGYLFTSGALLLPDRFTDAASFLDALLATPALAAGYTITQPTPTTVRLTATVPGVPGEAIATSSNAACVSVSSTPGAPELWSQNRVDWACYVEVWAGCGAVYGGPVDKKTAKLAQRVPLSYRADNAYTFDIASALRGFTGHAYPLADGSCPDRLVSYFLRFGEEFADATGRRRPRTRYESAVAWGLEAMEVPAEVGGLRLLSARPMPWVVGVGEKVPAWLLGKPNLDARTLLRYRLATSRTTTDVLPGHLIATGTVTQGGDKLLAAVGALSGELRVSDTASTDGPLLAALTFVAGGRSLTFANRQGGFDKVPFFGSQDENSKRTAATFTNTAGPQNLSAEQALTSKLYSGQLDAETWNWLRRELAVSPAVWVESDAGPVPVLLADLTTESDTIKGEYSLSVDLTLAPVRGLSN
jgi:hypothetical protein